MSDYKLVDSTELDSDLSDIADAIRAKTGGSSPLAFPSGFITGIGSIPSGGGGITITNAAVQIKNSHGSQINCNRLRYNAYNSGTSGLGTLQSNISNGSTLTDNNMAIIDDGNPEGPYFVFHSSTTLSTFTYNNVSLTVDIYGSSSQKDYHVHLPTGFDNSYPIEVI